jgi:hypothetical protein
MKMTIDRVWKLGLFAAAASIAAITPSTAQPDPRDAGRVVIVMVPQFMVEAETFHAADETGRTDWGSDEVHAVFADFDPIEERATKEYDNVDTGETIAFIPADRCVSPLPNCVGGKDSVRFKVSLWEADANVGLSGILGLDKPDLIGAHDMDETGIDNGDDLIGRYQVILSTAQLLVVMPNVGDALERQVLLHSGTDRASYRFNYRVTRLPDVRRRVVIPVPTREP